MQAPHYLQLESHYVDFDQRGHSVFVDQLVKRSNLNRSRLYITEWPSLQGIEIVGVAEQFSALAAQCIEYGPWRAHQHLLNADCCAGRFAHDDYRPRLEPTLLESLTQNSLIVLVWLDSNNARANFEEGIDFVPDVGPDIEDQVIGLEPGEDVPIKVCFAVYRSSEFTVF